MRLEEKRSGVKRRGKSIDLIRTEEKAKPFRIEEIVQPEDLRILREYFRGLAGRGRMYNASEIVSALTLAYGHRPKGFDSEEALVGFIQYVHQETSFKWNEVLQSVIIAYPEERERFAPFIASALGKVIPPEERPPYVLGPEEIVLVKILKPELQHQMKLDPERMAEKEEEILKKISDPNFISVIAQLVVPMLLADPSFKVRIPNVDKIISDMKKEIARLRHQNTDEAWKNIAHLVKGIALLSADQVGINNKGGITLGHNGQLPGQATMPERAIF